MNSFDRIALEVNGFFKKKYEEGRRLSEFYCREHSDGEAGSGIVLKSDTFLELGGPQAASCAFAVCTERQGLLADGRIRLIGPDMAQTDRPYPFGQIILAEGRLDRKRLVSFGRSQHINPGLDGYMVKSSVKNVWGRVSMAAGEAGFSFETLGSALISAVKRAFNELGAVEVLFVTSAPGDVEELVPWAEEAAEVYQSLKEEVWSAKGINLYDCAFHGNCDSCGDKKACDGIRDVIKSRRGRSAQKELKL